MPMTQEEYVSIDGSKCPYCGSEHLAVYASAIVVGKLMSRNVVCASCKKRYVENYVIESKLTGYKEHFLDRGTDNLHD